MTYYLQSKLSQRPHRRPLVGALSASLCMLLVSGCVNDTGTGALTSTQIQDKQSTHEQRHVAGKCNSANRLKTSNLASEALNRKFTAYSENEPTMAPDRKAAIVAELQSQGSNLESLDKNLNAQCVSWSSCEFQASTNKQDCTRPKHMFLDAEKQVVKFTKQIASIKVK